MRDDREEWLRQRAYAIWEAEGRPSGRDGEHWQQAEHELSAIRASQAAASASEAAPTPDPVKKTRRKAAATPSPAGRGSKKKAAELRP